MTTAGAPVSILMQQYLRQMRLAAFQREYRAVFIAQKYVEVNFKAK
jgi:hypothetical protein